jgi:hypothetical protein
MVADYADFDLISSKVIIFDKIRRYKSTITTIILVLFAVCFC